MTIKRVELSDKFHVWVAITNQIIHELNKNVVLESRQQLKTVNKDTLISSINELYDNTIKNNENSNSNYNISARVLSSKIKLQTGSEGMGNSYIEFWDDSDNLFRKLVYNHIEKKFYVEDKDGNLLHLYHANSIISGNESTLLMKVMTPEENSSYKGKLGEFVFTLGQNELYIHDGSTLGGLHVPIKTDVKVKVSENDGSSGYLEEKISEGSGIKITKNISPINDNENLVISNTLYNEFPKDHLPNTYLRRNGNNSLYEPVSIEQIKNEMGIDALIEQLKESIKSELYELGDIKPSLRTNNHNCWLLCNGQAVSRTKYSELFELIGTYFGEGDGSTTFNIPDYRGKFLRGLGGDSAPYMNLVQNEGLPNIKGIINNIEHVGGGNASGAFTFTDLGGNGSGGSGGRHKNGNVSLDASKSSNLYGLSEHVTPINHAVNWFIKAEGVIGNAGLPSLGYRYFEVVLPVVKPELGDIITDTI